MAELVVPSAEETRINDVLRAYVLGQQLKELREASDPTARRSSGDATIRSAEQRARDPRGATVPASFQLSVGVLGSFTVFSTSCLDTMVPRAKDSVLFALLAHSRG